MNCNLCGIRLTAQDSIERLGHLDFNHETCVDVEERDRRENGEPPVRGKGVREVWPGQATRRAA